LEYVETRGRICDVSGNEYARETYTFVWGHEKTLIFEHLPKQKGKDGAYLQVVNKRILLLTLFHYKGLFDVRSIDVLFGLTAQNQS
jgi:hypothetical protein